MTTSDQHDFDPFSPEPPAPAIPAPTAPPPAAVSAAAPVSAAVPTPAAPTPAAPARASTPAARMSPATVFLGSYAFVGIAAVLLATAIAALVALSDFRSSAPLLVAAVSVVVAAVVVWLGVLDDRGRGWARTATWVGCGLAACAAVAVFVVNPGTSVAWFAQLLRLGAVATFIVAASSTVLLALPESNAYFRRASRTEPVAAQPLSPPATGYAPAPRIPTADESDRDPFS